MEHKKELLNTIFDVYSRWVERFPFVCQKGCAACCTQSVTMTTLEGELILDFIKKKGREHWLNEMLTQTSPGKRGATITTNQYARACLEHRDLDENALGDWNFAPCNFLVENKCTIYEVRPFGCRSFGSLARCSPESAAEMLPIHLTVNTVLTQVIEHLNSDGGHWGHLGDILRSVSGGQNMHLSAAQPIPGFLLEPHEVKMVRTLLNQLGEQTADQRFFSDLIDNFMPI